MCDRVGCTSCGKHWVSYGKPPTSLCESCYKKWLIVYDGLEAGSSLTEALQNFLKTGAWSVS